MEYQKQSPISPVDLVPTTKEEGVIAKQPYDTPALIRYGSIIRLTEGTTSPLPDGSGFGSTESPG